MSLLDKVINIGSTVSYVGVDIGTSSVLVYVKDKGIVLKEPSVVAFDKYSKEIKAIGANAYMMLCKAPENIVVDKPLICGVIANDILAERMIHYFINKALYQYSFVKPKICASISCGATEVDKMIFSKTIYDAGARDVVLLESPIAAATGIGFDVSKSYGSMIVDIGGGVTDIAIVSFGGIVAKSFIKIAGDKFNQDIMRFIKHKYNVLIGEITAETIKIEVGCCHLGLPIKKLNIKCRDMMNGMPTTITVTSEDVEQAIREDINFILTEVVDMIGKIPPELAKDILERGIILTGGGSLLRGIDVLIEEKTKINTTVIESPFASVAIGAGEHINIVNNIKLFND